MLNYIFVQDRESQEWRCTGTTGTTKVEGRTGRYGRGRKYIYYAPTTYLTHKPTDVSAFIADYQLIKAETEEDAWKLFSSR